MEENRAAVAFKNDADLFFGRGGGTQGSEFGKNSLAKTRPVTVL